MPKMFWTLFVAGTACLIIAVVGGLFVPREWLDPVNLWQGLHFTEGILVGAAWTCLKLYRFQSSVAAETYKTGHVPPCIHTIPSLSWFITDMIGPATQCGFVGASGSASLRSSSARGSSSTSTLKRVG